MLYSIQLDVICVMIYICYLPKYLVVGMVG